jgi:Arc/MetJ family transcription regulator
VILCIVCAAQARRKWGSLHLKPTLRPLTVSMSSCAVICAVCVFLLTLQPAGASRVTDVMVAALAIAAAVLIHAAALTIDRSAVAAALPAAAKWLRAPATVGHVDHHTAT